MVWLTRTLLSLPNYIVNNFASSSSNNNCYNGCNDGCHFCDLELISLEILYITSVRKLATFHYLFDDLYCCCTILQAETTTIVETTIVTAIILFIQIYIHVVLNQRTASNELKWYYLSSIKKQTDYGHH